MYYVFCNGGYRITVANERQAADMCRYLHLFHADSHFSYCYKPYWDALLIQHGLYTRAQLARRSSYPRARGA